jgi:hypothetical protein
MEGEQLPGPQSRVSPIHMLISWLGFQVRAPKPKTGAPASLEAIRASVYDMPAGFDWDKMVSSGLDDALPAKMLDELWAPDDPDRNPRKELIAELFRKAVEKYRQKGIEFLDLNIGPWQVEDEVVKLRRDWWQAFWLKDGRVTVSRGEAEALQILEQARIEAQSRVIQAMARALQGLESVNPERLSQVIALRFIDTIEAIAGLWLSDENRADYLSVLKELRRLSGPADTTPEPQRLPGGAGGSTSDSGSLTSTND